MKRVRSFDTDFEAEWSAGLLRARDIPCEVRGLTLSEEPPFATELWVLRDEDLQPAVEAMRVRTRRTGPAWICSNCRTRNEPSFDACWSCGAIRA